MPPRRLSSRLIMPIHGVHRAVAIPIVSDGLPHLSCKILLFAVPPKMGGHLMLRETRACLASKIEARSHDAPLGGKRSTLISMPPCSEAQLF